MSHYTPLPAGLTINKSPIDGLGVFATEDIPRGLIGVGWVEHESAIGALGEELFPDGYVRTPLGGFINHSKNPNCTKVVQESLGVVWVKSMCPLLPGDELTMEYTLYSVE